MKRTLFFLLVALAVMLSISFSALSDAAEITYIKGGVQVQVSGQQTWKRAEVGMKVDLGDSVRTALWSKADIALDTAKKNLLRLEGQTLVVLNSSIPGEVNRFDLSHGKVYANIAEAKAGLTYEVSTPSAVAGVRGTGLSVESDNKGDEVSTYEKSVGVKSFDKSKKVVSEIVVPEGFKTMVKRHGKASALIQLTTREMQRWRDMKKDSTRRTKQTRQRGQAKKKKLDTIDKMSKDTTDKIRETKDAIEESTRSDEERCPPYGGEGS